MNRREAIKKTSLMLGFAASSPAIISILNGCVPEKTIDWEPKYFTREQAQLVAEIAETILPKTDTPGARDVGVDAFIDHIVYECFSDEEKQDFIDGLKKVDEASGRLDEEVFIKMDTAKKSQLLAEFENKAIGIEVKTATTKKPFFSQIKALTLLGYFTSKEIMTNHLEYTPVPTRFDGCIEMKNNQKLIVGNHV